MTTRYTELNGRVLSQAVIEYASAQATGQIPQNKGKRMKPIESVKAFEDFAIARGLSFRSSTPREGIEAMLEFREAIACITCSDDMLLYQWGSYDWGAGKHFELNITRQFIEADLEDDDAISQLSLTYRYKPSAELEALGASNCWEDGLPNFRQFILDSASFIAVADTKPEQVEIFHEYV